jgi:hypothetical protein
MQRANKNMHEAWRISRQSHHFHIETFYRDIGVRVVRDPFDDRLYRRRISDRHGVNMAKWNASFMEDAVDGRCGKVKGFDAD